MKWRKLRQMHLLLTLTGRAPQSSIFFSASTGVILQFVKKAIRVSATKQENAVGLHCVSAGSAQKKHYKVHEREQDRFRCAYGKSWGAVGVKVSEMYVKEISLPSKRSVHFNCEKRDWRILHSVEVESWEGGRRRVYQKFHWEYTVWLWYPISDPNIRFSLPYFGSAPNSNFLFQSSILGQ